MIIPPGLFALADLLDREGHDVNILHTGLEEMLDDGFNLEHYIKREKPDLICAPLHWHHQCYEVYETLRGLKKAFPDIPTVLGGFTASYFARSILEEWDFIDFVIRGEAEIPIKELAEYLESSGDLSGVPNLSLRDNHGRAVHNNLAYCATVQDLDLLNFSRLELMDNYEHYRQKSCHDIEDGKGIHDPGSRIFYLTPCRGCPGNCAFCGGARASQKIISGRNKTTFRSAASLFRDIEHVNRKYKIDVFGQSHSAREPDNLYLELFKMIRESGMRVSMVFEYNRKEPDRRFILDFSKTFKPADSLIYITANTFSDRQRRLYYPHGMTNSNIKRTLETAAENGIGTALFFSIFPGESEKEIGRGLDFALKMKNDCGTTISIESIEIEPGSLWSMHPDRYGIDTTRINLEDYLEHHRRRTSPFSFENPGYSFDRARLSPELLLRIERLSTVKFE